MPQLDPTKYKRATKLDPSKFNRAQIQVAEPEPEPEKESVAKSVFSKFLSGPLDDDSFSKDIEEAKVTGKPLRSKEGTPWLPDLSNKFREWKEPAINEASKSNYPKLSAAIRTAPYEIAQTGYDFIRSSLTPEGIIGSAAPRIPNWAKNFKNTKPLNIINPPVLPKKQLALPPGRGESYIGGPTGNPLGAVAPKNVPPEVAAQVSGIAIPEKAASRAPSYLDLEAKKEAERVANLNYTDFELKGGKALTVGDEALMQMPVKAGDTRLGFENVSRANLEYPLNVVPEAVRPRRAQTVTRALQGDVKVNPPASEKITFGNEELPVELSFKNERPPYYSQGFETIREGEEIIPSAPIKPSRLKKNKPVIPPKVPPTNKLVSSTDDDAMLYAGEKGPDNPLAMADTRLRRMGSSGVELYRRAHRFVQEERFNIRDWAQDFRNKGKGLSKEEQTNFGKYVEGLAPIKNPRLQAAVDAWKKGEDLAGTAAEQVGMANELGEPFKKVKGYWPHRLTDAEIKELPKKIEQMIAQGMTRHQAEQVMAKAKKFGELILPQQHTRLGKLFEYRNDFESGLQHLETMAKAVARTKNFGRKDVAGQGLKGIDDLIKGTSNPDSAYKIMKRIVGREEGINKKLDNIVRASRTAVSWMNLQNYGISSIIGNQLPNMINSNTKQYLNSLKNVILRDKANKRITDEAAAMIDISRGIFEHTSKFTPMKIYGGEAAENFVRSQSAGIGHARALTLFRELKKNPKNNANKKELFELILEPVEEVVSRQVKLSDDQLRMAAGRFAEKAQGLTNPVNLPMWMSKPVEHEGDALLQLVLIYKKQATLQTKMLKDAMKRNPVKTAALLASFSQVGGEGIRRIKSGIKGASKSVISGRPLGEEISDALEHRSDYLGRYGFDDKMTRDIIDRTLQSWSLGIASDMAFWALDKSSFMEGIFGPVAGNIADIATNIHKPKQLGRETLKRAPIPGGVGTAMAEELLPTLRDTRNREKRKYPVFQP